MAPPGGAHCCSGASKRQAAQAYHIQSIIFGNIEREVVNKAKDGAEVAYADGG